MAGAEGRRPVAVLLGSELLPVPAHPGAPLDAAVGLRTEVVAVARPDGDVAGAHRLECEFLPVPAHRRARFDAAVGLRAEHIVVRAVAEGDVAAHLQGPKRDRPVNEPSCQLGRGHQNSQGDPHSQVRQRLGL